MVQPESRDPRVRLRRLCLSRVGIAAFLSLLATITAGEYQLVLPGWPISVFHGILLAACLLSLLWIASASWFAKQEPLLYLQAAADAVLITALVYVTGGIQSVYSVFYPLVIITSVLFLGRRGGLILASLCSILYGVLMDVQYYRITTYAPEFITDEASYSAGYVLLRIFIHILSFYVVALLASYVVDKERQLRFMLQERENAFNQLDLLYRSIIESVDAGILTLDPEGRIKSFNRAAQEIVGRSAAEVKDRPIETVFPDFPQLKERLGQADAPRPRNRVEWTLAGRDGRPVTLGCSLSPLFDHRHNRIGDIVTFQDLTALKEMEASLEQNRRLAFVGELSASLAHEIRNPLAAISGSIQMLLQEPAFSSADERLMQIILRGKNQLEHVLRDFLLLSRPAPGGHTWVDLGDVVSEVLEDIAHHPDWSEHILVRRTDDGEALLQVNRQEIIQILWNVLINAAQAMPAGGTIAIETTHRRGNGAVRGLEMTLRDQGPGISPEISPRLFEPFFTTKEQGTGLGLTVVKRLMDHYDGCVTLANGCDGGAVCTLRFPEQPEKG